MFIVTTPFTFPFSLKNKDVTFTYKKETVRIFLQMDEITYNNNYASAFVKLVLAIVK